MTLPRATAVSDGPATDTISLGYDARLLRRKRLVSDGGAEFLVDLPETVSLNAGDCLSLENGSFIEVRAAPEPLLEIKGDLPRLAWHIGNRHTPCQILPDCLLIQRDRVLQDMLDHLGAELREIEAPFAPEGGAYGHGRTFGHSHGDYDHFHAHDHVHE